jgi:hypothetical protein
MREYKIIIAEECCTARSAHEHSQAIEHLKARDDAKVLPSSALHLGRFAKT